MLQKCEHINHKANNLHTYFENYLNTILTIKEGTLFDKKHCPNRELSVLFAKKVKGKRTDLGKLVDAFQDSFLELVPAKRKEYIKIFQDTNDVDNLFNNPVNAVRKKDYPGKTGGTTQDLLVKLFKDTFDNKIVEIKSHYEDFFGNKKNSWCPFCGMEKFYIPEDRRQDYDHMLSKTDYPVAAINMNNLIPMGEHCNQVYKKDDDILLCPKGKPRRVANPYIEYIEPKISLEGSSLSWSKKEEAKWKIKVTPKAEKVDAWEDVFKITHRCNTNYLKWFNKNEPEYIGWIDQFISSCSITLRNQKKKFSRSNDWEIEDLDLELEKELETRNNLLYKESNLVRYAVYDFLLNHSEETLKLSILDVVNADNK